MDFTDLKQIVKPGKKLDPQQLRSALRVSIAAQHDAASLYDLIAQSTDDPNVKKIVADIANEEKIHVGQFEKLLDGIDPQNRSKQKQGRSEAQKKARQPEPQANRLRDLRGIQ